MDLSRHRNLFNGDSTFLFGGGYLGLMDDPKGPFTAQVMHRFIDLLADNGVDTYLCNPQAQVPWYPSRVSRTVLTGYRRGDKEFFRGHYPPANDTDLPKEKLEAILEAQVPFLNRYLDLVEAGVDWVAEIAKACRRRGVSPWLTFRMNDLHGANNWAESYMIAPPQRDPRTRLSGRQPNPREPVNRFEQGMDWGKAETRDYQFSLTRELVEDYDYEGLEMDWTRQPYCCEAPASRDAIETMTEWVGRVRELTSAKGKRLGRPFPVG